MSTTITHATPRPRTTLAARARNLTKTYGTGDATVRALDGVTVEFPVGTFTAVMGPSGSGKSTLMHCLAGLDTVDTGEVQVAGIDIVRLDDQRRTLLRREQIGFVFQSFNLIPALTAEENILLPLELAGQRADRDWFDQLVATLGLGDRLGHTPAELSGGQQQRVAVARALVTRPALVFADEPTGNLDSVVSNQILGFLRDAVDELDQSIVMVTHDPTAAAYADRVVLLADGRIVDEIDQPSVDTVLDRMKHLDPTTQEEW